MSHVFISYTAEDRRIASELARKIRNETGNQAWIDAENIEGGESWRAAIDKALRDACAVIVLVSPAAKKSEYVTYEWAFALGVGTKVIPILVTNVKNLHPALRDLQYIDFANGKKNWTKVLKLVNQPPCTKSPQSSTQQTPSRKSPDCQKEQ